MNETVVVISKLIIFKKFTNDENIRHSLVTILILIYTRIQSFQNFIFITERWSPRLQTLPTGKEISTNYPAWHQTKYNHEFVTMNIHWAQICTHWAIIFKHKEQHWNRMNSFQNCRSCMKAERSTQKSTREIIVKINGSMFTRGFQVNMFVTEETKLLFRK